MESFEQDGVVSVWAFLEKEDPADAQKDVLTDMCGVEDYDIDSQEGVTGEEPQPLALLIADISYIQSFADALLAAADLAGVKRAYGVIAQFDFRYNPRKVSKPVAKDPFYIGCFRWHE